MPSAAADSAPIASIRHFNRFYTRVIGTLDEGLLQSPHSLTESRVLYELATRQHPTASEIAADLGVDMGYLSRILRTFEAKKLLSRQASASDARQSLLSLTATGRRQFRSLDQSANEQVRKMIHPLPIDQQTRLLASMASIESLLATNTKEPPQPFILRPHRPGDIGWVVERHGALYAQEYGWDQRFEALVARIAADFIDNFDPKRERCWIADRNGERLGCVFLVRDAESPKSYKTARLRLLLVEPSARGLGLGRTLVRQCTEFARSAGYRRIVLWTNSVLDTARRIYQDEGYKLLSEKPYSNFGKELVTQDWELKL
jgi:DNA-binding MarR family transcriptional regulator/GNAT superfamily N-acetyltransferase